MEHLWSPWRMPYVQNTKQEPGCVFCNACQQKDGPENLVIYRGVQSFVILNRFPYTSGHLMIVPYLHTDSLDTVGCQGRAEMMELTNQALEVLKKSYYPQGFNLGVNLGDAGGAGIADHIHFHVVPRWAGDTNFMTTLGMTRVMPEALAESYQRIKAAWQKVFEE